MSRLIMKFNQLGCKILKEQRRFAGHSKWQNIRHIKAEKDHEKALLVNEIRQKMRAAVIEGKGIKMTDNSRLAQIIEYAKKSNVPNATINSILSKLEVDKTKSVTVEYCIQSRGGWYIIVFIDTDNIQRTRNFLQNTIKKYNAEVVENIPKNLFDHIGLILAKKDVDLDTMMSDALEMDVIEVEEVDTPDGKCFQLICEPPYLGKTKGRLEALRYHIISADKRYIPLSIVEVSPKDMKSIDLLCEKLSLSPDIVRLENNIANE